MSTTNLVTMLRMDTLQAARFRDDTAGQQNRLEPIQGRNPGGTQFWYLPKRVIYDPAFLALRPVLHMLTEVGIDASVVFPPTPEERAQAEAQAVREGKDVA
jgi:hypothetical protein